MDNLWVIYGSGWWLSLPLWNIWVRQLGWWHSQLNGKIKKCSKPQTRWYPTSPVWSLYSCPWYAYHWRLKIDALQSCNDVINMIDCFLDSAWHSDLQTCLQVVMATAKTYIDCDIYILGYKEHIIAVCNKMGLELPVFRQTHMPGENLWESCLESKLKKRSQRGLFLRKSKGINEKPTSWKWCFPGPISSVTDSDFFHSRAESAPHIGNGTQKSENSWVVLMNSPFPSWMEALSSSHLCQPSAVFLSGRPGGRDFMGWMEGRSVIPK